jgi:hypothetical protein
VLRYEGQVDDSALVARPGDPDATDGSTVEHDQLVLRAGEARLPCLALSAELEIEERLARSVVPARDVGPGRGVQPTQERLIGPGGRTSCDC